MKGFPSANFLFIAYSLSATFPSKCHNNYTSYTHLQALPHRESKRITQQSRNTGPVCTNVPVFPFLEFDLYPSAVAQLGVWFPRQAFTIAAAQGNYELYNNYNCLLNSLI